MPTKTVLIVDHDLGFVFWLGHMLDDAGYQAFPANSAASAVSLVGQFHLEINLLILNPAVRGVRAFAKKLRLSQGHLKTIAVIDEQEGKRFALPKADALMHKPAFWDEPSRIVWLETIEKVFEADDAPNVHSTAP